jgi:glutamate-1-semialdehyde 2,1-aminomutase
MTLGIPDSSGVPEALAALTRVAGYNDLEAVERYFEAEPSNIAAIIVEPVAANMGVVKPHEGFLKRLSAIAHKFGALLICDEVITGFRLRFGAACEMLGADPDLIMLGKVIGGGMPIGAVAGRAELMDKLAPAGPVYQAGTLSGNPLSVRAGLATLALLKKPDVYERLEKAASRLASGFKNAFEAHGATGSVNRFGSLLTVFFGVAQVTNASDARRANTGEFAEFFKQMLNRGFYLPPSQFEALFVSLAHNDEIVERTITAAEMSISEMQAASAAKR